MVTGDEILSDRFPMQSVKHFSCHLSPVTFHTLFMETKIEIAKNIAGGNGEVIKKHILGKDELNDKTRMFAEITLAPGTSIGYHPHNGESETYYFLAGTGTYNDNGATREVGPGDVTFTPGGCAHGIENTGTSSLVFIALILRD